MNCWLQEGVDRSSWTSESDEKEAQSTEEPGGTRQEGPLGGRWRTGRLLVENGTAVIVIAKAYLFANLQLEVKRVFLNNRGLQPLENTK